MDFFTSNLKRCFKNSFEIRTHFTRYDFIKSQTTQNRSRKLSVKGADKHINKTNCFVKHFDILTI